MTTLHLKPSMNGSPLRLALLLVPLVLVCFALSLTAQAQISPAPDGGGANQNTAEGDFSLAHVTTGSFNTALGFAALDDNANGSDNTATGFGALFTNTMGGDNTANGFQALLENTTGTDNTAVGSQALPMNTGSNNTAVGSGPLFTNSTGNDNTAVGFEAMVANDGGSNNIALGSGAGSAVGSGGSDNIEIGNDGGGLDTGTIRIGTVGTQGSCFIAGIFGVNSSPASAVFINSNGQLGTVSSSRRFKKEIKPMDKTSEAILAFKPVTFRYKNDDNGTPQFGLIAEDVAQVNPDLVVRDADGKVYTVRYEAINAMLLNEFLKEHKAFLAERRKVQKQEAAIAELKSGMKTLIATVKEQSSQIQKVSAQLELRKPSPQTVLNNQ